MGIGTQTEARSGTLGDKLRGRAGHSGEQPIKAAFASNEFDSPGAILVNQFVVPFGNPKDFVHRFDPFFSYLLLSMHGREHFAQRTAEPPGLQ